MAAFAKENNYEPRQKKEQGINNLTEAARVQVAVGRRASPVIVQCQRKCQPQRSDCPAATSQTDPHSPWYKYISAGQVPVKEKNNNE